MFYFIYLQNLRKTDSGIAATCLHAAELNNDGKETRRICLYPEDNATDTKWLKPYNTLLEWMLPEDRILLFTNAGQLNAFHIMKRRLHLHANTVENFDLSEYIDVELRFHPESTLDEIVGYMEYYGPQKLLDSATVKIKKHIRKLEGIQRCGSYIHILDKKEMVYHSKTCSLLSTIDEADLQGTGNRIDTSRYSPCPHCITTTKTDVVASPSLTGSVTSKSRTKAELMREAIENVCTKYHMHAEFVGGMVYITTVAGEWYFDYNNRPIILKHKNSEVRYDQFGNSKGNFHKQQLSFHAPLQAIAYIYKHEKSMMRRLMENWDAE